MSPEENYHNGNHEYCMKYIQHVLMLKDPPIIPHQILHNSKDTSDQNNGTGEVENRHAPLPRNLVGNGESGGLCADAQVEAYRADKEEAEEDDLNQKTCDDDLLAHVEELQSSPSLDTATHGLDEERETVACNENLRKPFEADEAVWLAIHQGDDAAEDHIDRGCEEGGRDEDHKGLDNEAWKCKFIVVGPDTTAVSYCLHFGV